MIPAATAQHHRSRKTCPMKFSRLTPVSASRCVGMPTFQTYNVTPTLPVALEPLREMSFNLWWTWEPSARRLFRLLDPELWNRTNHNPVRMLQLSRQSRLEELAQDKNFLRELKQVFHDFEKYLGRHDNYGNNGPGAEIKNRIAYFSVQIGFDGSIPH